MRVTDEMVAIAMAAFEAYFQDPAHESPCDECNGEGCTPVGVDSDRDWCPKCGGPGTLNAATEEGGIRAALEAALSHAAGQDGEQCRAASVEPDAWLYEYEHDGESDHCLSRVRFLPSWVEAKRATEHPLYLRALSRGVPEGRCQHAWQPDPDVMNARYCPKCDVTQTIAAQRKEG